MNRLIKNGPKNEMVDQNSEEKKKLNV